MDKNQPPDTIFALTTGVYRVAIAVIRVSGPKALETVRQLAWKTLVEPRILHRQTFTDPESGKVLDHGMMAFFPGPNSYSGEDVIEYHLHGGRAIIEGMLKALGQIPGCRYAEPGEFTKRGFENGKFDLTECEAINDIVDAETEAQKIQALDQYVGSLSQLYRSWTDMLSGILAHQEAEIEFPEDDLPQGLSQKMRPEIEAMLKDIKTHLNDGRRGERLRNGLRLAIVGAPNAGKSSLLNALAQRDAAIVSPEAGTTRDVIEVHLDLGGYPVIVSDTAGLRETESLVEKEGIRRAENAAKEADFKLALFDAAQPQDAATQKLIDKNTIVVYNKTDLVPAGFNAPGGSFLISAKTGQGLDEFLKQLTAMVAHSFKAKPGPVPSRARHRAALEEAVGALDRCLEANLPELAAEDMRLAVRALGTITGRVHVEDVMDKIFKNFCIGK